MATDPVRDYTSGATVLPDWNVQEMIFRLIASGVFERYPRLRFVCAEFEAIGVENLMWSDDYPHLESCWPDSAAVIDRVMPEDDIPTAERSLPLGGNASRIYGW